MNLKQTDHFETISKAELIKILNLSDDDFQPYYDQSITSRALHQENKVYLRGLIELSNHCQKDCYYCGIRKENKHVQRYTLSIDEALQCAKIADIHKMGSLVIQSGERSDPIFTQLIKDVLIQIKKNHPQLAITLSCGEQTLTTYQQWKDAGAERYLLRIESSHPILFKKLHPSNSLHLYNNRLAAIANLKEAGYQVGSGVMIGLPNQTVSDLANDLLTLRELDIDMCGMGPYLEHEKTPLFKNFPGNEEKISRAKMTLRMICLLKLLMPKINIAATTALETIDPEMRFQALKIGANVMMPNLTPQDSKINYNLYEGKKSLSGEMNKVINHINKNLNKKGLTLGLGEQGTSKHFIDKRKKESLC